MDKLKMHSPNLSEDNIARIRALFPGYPVPLSRGRRSAIT